MRFNAADQLIVGDGSAQNVYQVTPGGLTVSRHTLLAHLAGVAPIGITIDPQTQDVFIVDGNRGIVYRITSPGVFSAFATGLTQNSGPLDFDRAGNLYVGDTFIGAIWKFTRQITSTTLQIHPDHGGNAGVVTARVIGSGIQDGATVKLTGLGSDLVGSQATITSGSELTTTFDLTGASAGQRNLVVENPDGTSATLAGGFIVDPGGSPQTWVDTVGLDRIRIGTAQTFYITYGNRGNVDAVGVPIWVQVPSNVELSLGFDLTAAQPTQLSTEASLSSAAAADIPYQVTVGNSTIAGIFVPYVPAGSTSTLAIKLAVQSAVSTFQWRTWLFPPYLAEATGTYAGRDPVGALGCAADLASLIATGAFGASKAFVSALGTLLDVVTVGHDPSAANVQLSTWQVFNVAATDSGLEVFSADELSKLSRFGNVLDGISLIQNCGPFLEILFKIMNVQPVGSLDPNEKVGLQGMGPSRYVSTLQSFPYQIAFANLETATAPAQTVSVTDQLDTETLDLRTFSFGPITFGAHRFVPPAGRNSFAGTVDLRPGQDMLVQINGAMDQASGLVTWHFASLDPQTGLLVTDPLAGFLPPNASAGEGEGAVFFTVMSKLGLSTEIQIQNQASIVFDVNLPILTQIWTNTSDNSRPTSGVLSLPATQNSTSFPVRWTGADIGSGVQDFTIYVSDNGGPFTALLTNTAATSATFNGEPGHTYGFYSIARDLVGNVEGAKTAPEATTIVLLDTTPPTLTLPLGITAQATGVNGIIVIYVASAEDLIDGLLPVTCAPPSGSVFPVGDTTVTCTATDVAGNMGSGSFTVTVLALTAPDGRMHGVGHVDIRNHHYHFVFRVSQIGSRDYGRLEYWVNDSRRCADEDHDHDSDRTRDGDRDRAYGRDHRSPPSRFEATSITAVTFADDPSFRPGRGSGSRATIDTVSFLGNGRWNGRTGYTFEAFATDRGEPGRHRDTFSLVVKDSQGRVMADVTGALDGGNIQSSRLGR